MASVRTVDFLPEIFQTPVNRQFLNATLDQLVQEPAFTKTQGYVGRRVGLGVNPADQYVVEPTPARTNYQLEPGVISLEPDTNKIRDAITYPGITDALKMQGAIVDNADRLYTSEYYAWDPFVDFDKFVNYSQYYWLPGGPLSVDVSSAGVPLTDNFVVTRANGVYTFSGLGGANPALTLVRGGNYTFQVAQNDQATVNYNVGNNSTTNWIIDFEANPTLTLVRGNTYVFTLNTNIPLQFYIKTVKTVGTTNLYNSGVTNNGAVAGTITFKVPQDAPNTLYYANSVEQGMQGQFNIIDALPGDGPGFWIQTDPGVNGRVPAIPNTSSRAVLGVINNGTDLGTVTFDVPLDTAQNFYYNLTPIGPIASKPPSSVDLICNLKFNEIDNIFLDPFFAENPNGIDGITSLNGKTLVFTNQTANAQDGGWQQTTFFDPLPTGSTGLIGGFDSTSFAQTTDVPVEDRYSVWQIEYVPSGDTFYMKLNEVLPVDDLEKFVVLFGTQYSNTDWYKNSSGYFEQFPLLSAIKNVLFYQDGTDPGIFGQIRLINQDQSDTLYIDDILGEKNYTAPNGVVFTNGLKVTFRGAVEPASYQNNDYYVEGVGTAIQLLPVTDFVTPEPYTISANTPYDSTPYDVGGYDATLNAPLIPDYITINRGSPDLNAWSRSNRWFHIQVINASAEYNNTAPVIDNNFRAKRPVLEFNSGTKLFNFGTEGKQPVDIIDFSATDALTNINGSTGYSYDGYELTTGTRIIFANDTDPQVRNKIYTVEVITPDTVPDLIVQPVINLTVATDGEVLINQSVVCLSGVTQQGMSHWFDGVEWIESQEKTKINQAPLFDVYDSTGVSFADRIKYPSSSFRGSKLFSYATSNTSPDAVLGFPLRYLSLNNVGDIVFDNNFYKDTFNYTLNSIGQEQKISDGFARRYADRTAFQQEIGWKTAATRSLSRQQFRFTYDGSPLKLDIKVDENNTVPAIQLYIDGNFQNPGTYSYTTTDNSTTINLNSVQVPNAAIEVAVLSEQISKQGFYQVPVNLENNPFNENSDIFTLGTVRSHYETIGQNLINLEGPVIGPNNTRDLGDIVPYGQQILQQSSPLTLAGYFMRSEEYNIFNALEYNSREYIKFKSLLLENVVRNDYGDLPTAQILDLAIADITLGRTDINPFYWSDMVPTGSVFTETVVTVTPITTANFNTQQTYNFTSSNYLGLLVYLTQTINGQAVTRLLTRGDEYIVEPNTAVFTVIVPLQVGDVVTIREYSSTAGSFVPNTPTKMGLYPKFLPRIFEDPNYITPTLVIQGHDGSMTVAFGDYRDEILLEFEKRIYDNLKTDDNPIPLNINEVIPGYFRTTDYSQEQINSILADSFLTWVGYNKLDYKAQDYIANNPFTYNYSSAGNRLDQQPLLGAWRGIYKYFYDTTSPNLTPWEMLGLTEQPAWWEDRYGPAPYTSDNLVLWEDLAAGLVADPVAPYIDPLYVRPQLLSVIPNSSEGQLLSPLESVVGSYDPYAFQKSWAVGDGGPVEASWWTSSSYPFAVMRVLALTRPAQFFALLADRDLYKFNEEFQQYLYNDRYRLDANGLQVYGDGVSKASYINWIVDYNRQLGINSTQDLEKNLSNLDVRLCYRMGSFSDKQYIKIFLERQSPDSNNSSLLLPDDSYNLFLYKNQPFGNIVYSAINIEILSNGFAVYGYNTAKPYFTAFVSASNGVLKTVTGGGATVRVPAQYTSTVSQVPYGYVFTNATMVVDFILSYGAYLESQGLIFNDMENGYTLNWEQMAVEFLYFGEQGWAPGTLISLNPSAGTVKAYRPGSVIDSIVSNSPENMLLNQNRAALPTRDLIVQREGDSFSVTSPVKESISFVNLKFTNYETIIILDNLSIFNDLVYKPSTAQRQNRMQLTAATTTEWNGTLDAKGFILNEDNVKEWKPNRKYTKGEVVIFKNQYWQALDIVQPKLDFDFTDWTVSDYTAIQRGLLPNLANKADQLANTYNTQVANLESDNDLLAYGLIGYRPRQYMAALNLDDVTQVQLYQQFLGTKGTTRAAEIFTKADLGKETGQYSIYENWGILASTYGANANKSFVEFRLNEAFLKSDPSTVQVIQPGEPSQANQTILLNDVWRSSYRLTSTNILPTTYVNIADSPLPSAGYVNFDDVDITVFSLDEPASLGQQIDTIGIGTTVWAAKSNSYDWNIYRCGRVPGQLISVSDNLNGSSLAQFNSIHDLRKGDLVIVRYFNNSVNGVYRVISVPSIYTVVIAYQFPVNGNQPTITGTGLVFNLQSMRVSQASDIVNLSYADALQPGARAWVDNDGSGNWVVLQKQDPFANFTETVLTQPQANAKFATSLAQIQNLRSTLVGVPGIDNGYVYTYSPVVNTNTYELIQRLTLDTVGTDNYGSVLTMGENVWGVAGAPNSNADAGYATALYRSPTDGLFRTTQLFVADDEDFTPINFGKAVAVSQDEKWMYISAPESSLGGRVYAYGLVPVEAQSILYKADGATNVFNYSDTIVIDYLNPDQLLVTLDNRLEIYGIDYTINQNNIVFNTTPSEGSIIVILRRQASQVDRDTYYELTPSNNIGTGVGATFTVEDIRGDYSLTLVNPGTGYAPGDELLIAGTALGGTSPANDLVITIVSTSAGEVSEFTFTGSGDSTETEFFLNQSLYTATDLYSFSVVVDGVLQRPYIDYTFNSATTKLTIWASVGAGSDITVLSNNYWKYAGVIDPSLGVGINFGYSLSTTTDGRQIFIGSPNGSGVDADGGAVINSGNVKVYDRGVIKYVVQDPSQTTYSIIDYTPGAGRDPVSVILNNQYLEVYTFTFASGSSQIEFLNGQVNIDLDNNTITFVNIELNVGDIIEINTNQFTLVQTVSANQPVGGYGYGVSVDICPTNCSLYAGAPYDSSVLIEAGSVERNVNQSRVFGTTVSKIANPSLTPGDTIRINDVVIAVPAVPNNTVLGLANAISPVAYDNAKSYYTGDRVLFNSLCYVATATSLGNLPTNTSYWELSSPVVNVLASPTGDLEFVGDGVTKIFDIGDVYSSTVYVGSPTTVVYIDDVLQTNGVDYTYNNSTGKIFFVSAPLINTVVSVVSGRLNLSVINLEASTIYNRLTVLPGTTGTAFDDLLFDTFVFTQQITSPLPIDYAYFGTTLQIDTSAVNLIVGAPNGSVIEVETFDGAQTYFDDRSTTFSTPIVNCGVVYTYDFLPSANSSIQNTGKFVFGQQIYSTNLVSNNQFGSALDFTNGRIIVGAPQHQVSSFANSGLAVTFDNPDLEPAWKVIHAQQPVVDVNQLNSVFMYDRLSSAAQTYFDFIDPLQGKILGAARRNIDYIGAVDPASYNQGAIHNLGNSWGPEHVGEMWWDTDTVRFIDPNQDNLTYASRRWGQLFPGSRVDIYQWTASAVPPNSYTGPGTPFSNTSYTVKSSLNNENVFITTYYFWVRGISTVSRNAGKTLSSVGVANYITSPKSSGIPYIAALNSNSIAMYNALPYISAFDTIIHIDYDRQLTTANVHTEYQFITDGRANSFLNDNLYRKLQDSFCGVDTSGAQVPDMTLSPPERYGVQFRPRQSMFVNRFLALQNYLERTNKILKLYPIVETRNFSLLNSAEPEPSASSQTWDRRVANLEELSYQDLATVPLGYRYLVESASTQNGLWSIYEVDTLPEDINVKTLTLIRVQNYDTKQYWYHIDWYLAGYNSTIQPIAEVANFSALETLTLKQAPVGSSAKVTANAQGKFEIYLRTNLGWDRVGLQDGTIQFSEVLWNYPLGNFGFDVEVFDAQYFDQEPVIETRQIIRAINEELFIDDLSIERNNILILMFNFIYSEFLFPEWLIKTSLVDVDHNIRRLQPYQNYLRDNQTFVLDYIQEVKPYHVQVRAFNLTYTGLDAYPGQILDFDLPAYWNRSLDVPQYTSPVLLPYTKSLSYTESSLSDAPADAEIWTLDPWKYWYENYQLSLTAINIIDQGEGYTVAPSLAIDGVINEDFVVIINSAGRVISVDVPSTDMVYSIAPEITLVGGNGVGAKAVAVLTNNLIRSVKTTIKYDRYQYSSSIVDWQTGENYSENQQVRYIGRVWSANANINNTPVNVAATATPNSYTVTVADSTGIVVGMAVSGLYIADRTFVKAVNGNVVTLTTVTLFRINNTLSFSYTFNPTEWTVIPAALLSGVDRTQGFYVAGVNEPGRQLSLLIDGIDYPGVQVTGVQFNQDTGFDVGNYDINPFDNISFGPEGRPTYAPELLDAIYASDYLDPYLGILPAPAYNGAPPNQTNAVVVDGGAYVDPYESHAPEELVPGIEFDTLDFKITTTPGSDWTGGGHGFPIAGRRLNFDPINPEIGFGGLLDYPFTVHLFNASNGQCLVPMSYDWVNYTVDIAGLANAGDLIDIMVSGVGGGNQLYLNSYIGSTIGNTLSIPFPASTVYEFLIYNGQLMLEPGVDYTWAADYAITGIQAVYNPGGSSGTTLVVTSVLGISVGSKIVGAGFSSGQTVIDKINKTTLLISAAPDSTPNGTLTFYADTGRTKVDFTTTYGANDRINLAALGFANSGTTHSWSLPVSQMFESTGSLTETLTNSLQGTNPANLIVIREGIRARPAAGIRYVSDGATLTYSLSDRVGYSQSIITSNDVSVYVDQTQLVLNVDYVVDAWDGSSTRTITLFAPAALGSIVLISDRTAAQYYVNGDQLIFRPDQGLSPQLGDVIEIITWNDTTEQGIITQVFAGPQVEGTVITQPYDSTGYDSPNLNPVETDPGQFDFTIGSTIEKNEFDLGQPITDTERLMVTLNGRWLFNGFDFSIEGSILTIPGPALDAIDIVTITSFTQSVVPGSMSFRIFQDMRGVQALYRITPSTTTTLTQSLSAGDDIMYLANASVLAEPALNLNIWGVVMVNGERIMYRYLDTTNNTISGLLRGTAGTGAADHAVGADVTDMGRGNLAPAECQDYIDSSTTLSDGFTTTFVADDIDISTAGPVPNASGVMVYVGGSLQSENLLGDGSTVTFVLSNSALIANPIVQVNQIIETEGTDYTLDGNVLTFATAPAVGDIIQIANYLIIFDNPCTINFVEAPVSGLEVTILVRRGSTWYNPGPGTPSNGIPLQDTNNTCARFLRGD
jgi:hypothetical protein